MLYTLTDPSEPVDRLRLFRTLEAARSASGEALERPVYGIAARFDARARRLTLLEGSPVEAALDPCWSTPAQPHGDGSITARAPIPRHLFVRPQRRPLRVCTAVATSS